MSGGPNTVGQYKGAYVHVLQTKDRKVEREVCSGNDPVARAPVFPPND
jgi:hypothetical protein